MAGADYCWSCLTSVLQTAYVRGVQFDVAEPADGDSDDRFQVEWLYLTVALLKTGRVQIQAKLNELAWAYGRSDTVGKHQVPPYVGHSGVNSALLRGMIKGRAARFVQIGMRYRALCQAVKHELQLWIRAGWPPPSAVQRCFRLSRSGAAVSPVPASSTGRILWRKAFCSACCSLMMRRSVLTLHAAVFFVTRYGEFV